MPRVGASPAIEHRCRAVDRGTTTAFFEVTVSSRSYRTGLERNGPACSPVNSPSVCQRRHGDDDETTTMVLVVARPQCVVASAGVGIVVGCARDRTNKEMVSPDRSEESDLVANATTVSAASAYNVLDVVVAAAIATAAATTSVVLATATAAVTIAAVVTATATVNAAVSTIASLATANTVVFDATSTIALAANQASSATLQTV